MLSSISRGGRQCQRPFPGSRVILSEVGWSSFAQVQTAELKIMPSSVGIVKTECRGLCDTLRRCRGSVSPVHCVVVTMGAWGGGT